MTRHPRPTPGTLDAAGDRRDKDGLLIDEYSDPKLASVRGVDALDVGGALHGERLLDDIVDDHDGIEAVDLTPVVPVVDTIDSGARQRPNEDGESGADIEPHSIDDLQRASIRPPRTRRR